MTKPLIGILGAQGSIATPGGAVVTAYANDSYCQAVIAAGGVPIMLPVTTDAACMERMFAQCDGLLIPGGEDVDPRFYNEAPHQLLGTVNQLMDSFWIAAFEYARSHKLPMLGICRGLQLVNVALGGSLYQDLSEREATTHLHLQRQSRDYLMHKVDITVGSKLAELLGTQTLYSNTMHHQSVKQVGEGLRVVAQTDDGVVEGLENADGSIILVQWHPEELLSSEPRMHNLFTYLVRASSK